MKILLVNKFLYPNGGSETYIFKLGEELARQGHEVSFFGMADERNIVSNRVGAQTANRDFRGKGGVLSKLSYPFQIVYSKEARTQIRAVLDDFKPDVVHCNNINFQITPSILYEIKKDNIPIVWTAHDYMLVCPNHMMYIPQKGSICEACVGGHYSRCFRNRCLHGSAMKSAIAAAEGYYYKHRHTYRLVDHFICPSAFLAEKLAKNPDIAGKTITLHNFVDTVAPKETTEGDYVLYFGRFDKEKGIKTLIAAAKELPEIPFIFAGKGELASELSGVSNIQNVGFQSGDALEELIRRARCTVYMPEWYENCPFSVMESQMYRTPVIGARIGGIPELIEDGKTGLLFESGNLADLKEKIQTLYQDDTLRHAMREHCKSLHFATIEEYTHKLLNIYRGGSTDGKTNTLWNRYRHLSLQCAL